MLPETVLLNQNTLSAVMMSDKRCQSTKGRHGTQRHEHWRQTIDGQYQAQYGGRPCA
jgi:hypothetical protein